ncbi:hypothetical protein HRR83_006811 [Exophiala dermatitidis]|nr:hypothetical protein HRR74_005971 [Exophiala dermatitidis]KAJ4515205.1 hypothetical protein HRR73_005035 [Exophiala dermatitidis]KAJ4535392.1 hypothetical protein HRR77_008009 [Exophiala dermatitidis]KAJ4540727.1 hypothetical protein HRR76_004113 [Exophiala dermatitidis]KAJ4557012.1 hypothetical protein HRR79_008816 [Exophiala dermatitidis]
MAGQANKCAQDHVLTMLVLHAIICLAKEFGARQYTVRSSLRAEHSATQAVSGSKVNSIATYVLFNSLGFLSTLRVPRSRTAASMALLRRDNLNLTPFPGTHLRRPTHSPSETSKLGTQERFD